MALSSLEELVLHERYALKFLILRETNRLVLGKKPINQKIATFVKKYKENKDAWNKFQDSLSTEDLTRNLNVYQCKVIAERKFIKRYLRLDSVSRDVLKKFRVTARNKMSAGPQVRVAQGELLGREVTTPSGRTYYSFQGIPYAKPPIGSLRFKAPQYPDNWIGVRDASKLGPKCAQIDPYRPRKFDGNEDCLYLNVHTPKLHSGCSDIPVIVFVHGGRYIAGYGSYYQPDYFIEREVILVTTNYRLGMLGFLALDIPEVPGNAGLKDVVYALRWVKDNIEKFNGDPSNVTVFGESAGAATVSCFLTSPMCDNLFQKMILESGTCVHDVLIIKEDTVGKAKNVVKILGEDIADPHDLLSFLQEVPVEKLADVLCDVMLSQSDPRAYFSPVVEKVFPGTEPFLTEHPTVSLREGRYRKIPMVIGYNSQEGVLYLVRNKKGGIKYEKDFTYFLPRTFYANKKSEASKRFGEEVKKFYFGDKSVGDDTKEEYFNLVSDAGFVRDMHKFLDYMLLHQRDNIWLYKFSYMGSLNGPIVKSIGLKGASHSDQLGYQFFRPQKKELITDDDRKIIDFFSETWSNFAKLGDPTPQGPVTWKPISKTQRYCLTIDKEIQLSVDPDKERVEFWNYIYEKYGPRRAKL